MAGRETRPSTPGEQQRRRREAKAVVAKARLQESRLSSFSIIESAHGRSSSLGVGPHHARAGQDGGQSCIRGMGITVASIVEQIADGATPQELWMTIPILKWMTFGRP
jgi:hypothetical protein